MLKVLLKYYLRNFFSCLLIIKNNIINYNYNKISNVKIFVIIIKETFLVKVIILIRSKNKLFMNFQKVKIKIL